MFQAIPMHTLLYIIGLFLVAITAPLIAELLLVTVASLLPRSKTRNDIDRGVYRLAVVVPAHNEENSIGRCVESLRASASEDVKICVIAHNCTDSTASLAEFAGAEVLTYDDPKATGKGHVLRLGFEHAIQFGADAVLIVDADSTVSANLIPAIQRAFARGAEVVQCRYEMESPTGKVKTELISLALRGFNLIRPLGRQRLGVSAGILGNGFALTAKVIKAVPYDAMSVVEDLEYHLHLVLAGKRVHFLDEAVVSSELPVSSKGETAQHSRWEGGRLRVARMWLPLLFREVLRGRMNVIEPMLDLAGLPIAFGMMALLLATCLPVSWIRLYAVLSIATLFLHVLRAIWIGPRRFRTLRLLLLVPFYLFWKLRLIPNVLRASSAKASWIRTDRKAAIRSTL
jgi:cellulose synthase/poly-beta-1,6-N-acetylglucosamine synthase-like glycosyltransferase